MLKTLGLRVRCLMNAFKTPLNISGVILSQCDNKGDAQAIHEVIHGQQNRRTNPQSCET